MTSYAVFIPLTLFLTTAVECQHTCFLKYPNDINFKCDVKEQDAVNLTWSLFDTESNKTLIINICEATFCHPLIPKLADALFLASVTSEKSGLYIQSSTLHANVKYANLTKLSTFRQLRCQYEDKIITLCDSFDVHVDPTKLTVYELNISKRGDQFNIVVEAGALFPIPECTLYVDNLTVDPNPSLINHKSELTLYNLEDNPESDDLYHNEFFTYYGKCVYGLNVAELGHGFHQLRITASAKTSDQDRTVVTTDVMSINFDWPKEVAPVCNNPEVFNNHVILTCRSDVLSSPAGCEFEIRTNGTSLRLNYNENSTLTYADLMGIPKLVTECKTTWNTTYLGPGYHEFRVSVVTNDTMGNVTKFTSPYTTPLNLSNVSVPGCIYQEISEKAVIISCRENLTSKAVGCEYQIKTNGTLTQVKGDIQFDNYGSSVNGEFSTVAECNLTVIPVDLGLGYHQFRLTMVTKDAKGNLARVHFPIKSPLYFYLPDLGETEISVSDGDGHSTCDLHNPGNPPGTVRWTWVMSNGTLYNGTPGANRLSFNYQSLAANKNISCQPVSVLMDNLPKLAVDLVVFRNQQLQNFTANGQEGQLVVDIGSYVTLECLASGYPMPVVKFRQAGRGGSMTTRSPFYTFKVSSCLDGGSYVCSLKQWTQDQTLESNIEIIVKCQNLITNAVEYPRQFYTRLGVNLEITIPVSGYPGPDHYTLLRQSGNKTYVVTSGFRVSYHLDDNPDGTVVLSLTDIQDDQFTNYTFVFGNGMGSDQEYSFYLTEEPSVNRTVGSNVNSDVNVGAIVGGVCGGVAAVALIIVVIDYVNRRQKQSMKSNTYVFTNVGITEKQ